MTPLAIRVAAFLGAFLAFDLELIVGKLLLPRFGGGALVWMGATMLFQALVFAGYALFYLGLSGLGARRYARAHILWIAAAFFSWPIVLHDAPGAWPPLLRLVVSLSRAAALPFLVLMMTALALQRLTRRLSDGRSGHDPFSIYATANAGALAALASYPFVVEPLLSVRGQLGAWWALYAAFAAALAFSLWRAGTTLPNSPDPEGSLEAKPRRGLWILLSAASSAALLAGTNMLSFHLAAAPLLWAFPLGAYLLSYVLAFKARPWYPLEGEKGARLLRWLIPVALVPPLAIAAGFAANFGRLIMLHYIVLNIGAVFLVSLICSRALAEAAPKREGSLPSFYLSMGFGGWLGSAVISLLVPRLGASNPMPALDWLVAAAMTFAALAIRDWERLRERLGPAARVGVATAAAALLAVSFLLPGHEPGTLAVRRNLYGISRVEESNGLRSFIHGSTVDGLQSVDPKLRHVPLGYHARGSPFAEIDEEFGASLRSIGVIGLGAGVFAAYGRPGQTMDFFEIDPDVVALARDYFTYLKDSAARIRVVLGDARLSLAQEPSRYDLLVLAAFSGDAIPTHLLTREAVALDLDRLSPGGLLACHVSNRLLDLRPVLAGAASDMGLFGATKTSISGEFPTQWVVLSRSPERVRRLVAQRGWTDLESWGRGRRLTRWTDEYAPLLPLIRL